MQLTSLSRTSRVFAAAAILVLALSLPNGLWATSSNNVAASGVLTEWTIPTPKSGPSALVLDQSGSCCWFVEYYGNKLAHFNPNNNTFQEWIIPTTTANPYDLAITRNTGRPLLWGTEYGADKVFTFSPVSHVFSEYSLPHGDTGVGYISVEPGGSQIRVWFTETIRNANGELIYDPTTGNATLYEDYFPAEVGGGAFGVYAQPNSVWFAGFSAIVRWDRASQQYTMWQLPVHGSAIGRFTSIDSRGQLWYTQGTSNGTSLNNFVGVLRADSTIQEWRLPTPGADIGEISIDPQSQQPWVTERSQATGNGAIAVLGNSSDGTILSSTPTTAPSGGIPFTLAPALRSLTATGRVAIPVSREILGLEGEAFTEYALQSSAPQDVITDWQGNIWISEPGANKIARLSGLSPDFALSASPASMSLSPGSSGTASIIGTSLSGYQGALTISALNPPSGVTFSLDSHQLDLMPGGNASSQLTINVNLNTTGGTRQITLEGSDGTIFHTTSILLTVSNSSSTLGKSQCLIATATYGSELSSEIQLLRSFRDNMIKSKTGTSFLVIFNSWYYSFSPQVASYLSSNSQTAEAMKTVLYPLIGFLVLSSDLFSVLAVYPESATLFSGLLACCMIGAFYLGIPLGVIKRKMRFTLSVSIHQYAALLFSGLGGILAGLTMGSNALLMIASSIVVLSTMYGSAALTADRISQLGRKRKSC